MIDLHSHILPGVDDGAKNREAAEEMLRRAVGAGVDVIVATSHYSPEAELVYEQTFTEFAAHAATFGVSLLPGMEYDYEWLSEIPPDQLRGIGSTNWVLIDFKQLFLPSGANELLFKLRLQGRRVMVAHPERLFGRRYAENIDQITGDFGLQINAGSLLGRHGRETVLAAFDILSSYPYCLIAGDAHRPEHFRFPECEKKLRRFFPAGCVDIWMRENPRRLLAGEALRECVVPPSVWRKMRWKIASLIDS